MNKYIKIKILPSENIPILYQETIILYYKQTNMFKACTYNIESKT